MLDRCVFLGDHHFPYQDDVAIRASHRFMARFNPTHIYILGDMLEMEQVSNHTKNPQGPTVAEEVKCGNEYLDRLRDEFPKADIYYQEGNHERRYGKWMSKCGRDIYGVASLLDLLKLRSRGIHWVPYMHKRDGSRTGFSHRNKGDFRIIHGHKEVKNPAQYYAEKYRCSGISGHTHRAQTSWWRGEHNCQEVICNWTENGCLRNLDPDWMHTMPDWQHAFSCGEYTQGGMNVDLIPVRNGKAMYRGDKI